MDVSEVSKRSAPVAGTASHLIGIGNKAYEHAEKSGCGNSVSRGSAIWIIKLIGVFSAQY